MSITVDLRVPPGLPGPEVADFIERAEDAGFDGVGIPDRQQSGRDVYVLLSAAALRTSRVTVYPAVTNPITRHPAVLAGQAQSLVDRCSGVLLWREGKACVETYAERSAELTTSKGIDPGEIAP